MTGLILKDFLNLKKNFKIFGLLTIFYGFLAYTSGDSSFFSSIFTMLIAVLTISLYSYDEAAKWDAYALTMPISKENVVQGKYIMMLLLTLFGSVFGFAFSAIISILKDNGSMLDMIRSCGFGSVIVIIFYSITIPFITKLGVEKARMVFFAVYIIPFAIYYILSRRIKEGKLEVPERIVDLISIISKNVYIIIPLTVLAALMISYSISIRIYHKKEF